jgi:hypothetical protein
VHEKFTDPLVDEALFAVAKLQARAQHARRVASLTAALASKPVYVAPLAARGPGATGSKRRVGGGAALVDDAAIRAEAQKSKVNPCQGRARAGVGYFAHTRENLVAREPTDSSTRRVHAAVVVRDAYFRPGNGAVAPRLSL